MSYAREAARLMGGDIYPSHVAVPTPGHSRTDRGTILRDRSDGRGLLVWSFNGDWRPVSDHVHALLGIDRKDVKPFSPEQRRRLREQLARDRAEREAHQLQRCAAIVSDREPLQIGRRYLIEARRLPVSTVALSAAAGALHDHQHDGKVSMLALAHSARGDLRGVQMTKLRADGSGKRGSQQDRLTFGPYKGSACRLFAVTQDTMAVAEGVETALAFYTLRKVPTWATFGAANLQAFEPPSGIRKLIIAADGDAPGREAASLLADRLQRRIHVVIASAPDDLDWLDVLNRGGAPCR